VNPITIVNAAMSGYFIAKKIISRRISEVAYMKIAIHNMTTVADDDVCDPFVKVFWRPILNAEFKEWEFDRF
jgi:hypothetical protein